MKIPGKPSVKLIFRGLCIGCFLGVGVVAATAQSVGIRTAPRRLTMEQTINMAQEQSISSMINENIFASAYWNYRTYKAGRLPSLNFSAGVANIERSIVQVQNYETGEIGYRPVFRLSNDVSLFVRQRVAATGGELTLRSSLQRLDQFSPNNLTWYSQPITLTYMQPLFGYNSLKWEKKIEPHNFERAKLQYLENMESVTITAASYFWSLAMAELNRTIAIDNYENTKRLYQIAQERHKIGSITRDAVLQLSLRVLNDSLAINSSQINYSSQKNRLASFIGLREDVDIVLNVDYTLPVITLDYDMVLTNALKNSSFELSQKIDLLNAERSIAQAKANRGIDVSFNARFGLSKSDESFSKAYSHLRDQQVAGFSVGIPILDWGVGRGRVKVAESNAERVRYQQEQDLIDYKQNIFVRVMEFNTQKAQCDGALRAKNIADERFALSVESFERGTLSVTELNTAQSEKDSAQRNYISSLSTYWNSYFNLRKISLYDYLSRTDIGEAFSDAQFDKLIE